MWRIGLVAESRKKKGGVLSSPLWYLVHVRRMIWELIETATHSITVQPSPGVVSVLRVDTQRDIIAQQLLSEAVIRVYACTRILTLNFDGDCVRSLFTEFPTVPQQVVEVLVVIDQHEPGDAAASDEASSKCRHE